MKKIILIITVTFNLAFSYEGYKNSYDYRGDNRVSQKCINSLFKFDIGAGVMSDLILPNISKHTSDKAFNSETSYAMITPSYDDMKDEILDILISCENIYEQLYASKRVNYFKKVESTYFELKKKNLVK